MSVSTPANIRQRLITFLIAGIGGFLASATSFALAVYEAGHPPQIPQMETGERIDSGRWFITLRSLRVGTTPPSGIAPLNPKQIIMLEADFENRGASSSNLMARAISIATPAIDLQPATAYLERDKSFAGFLNPGMPERITLAWEWPQGTKIPEKMTFTINRQIYKLRDNLYGASGWFDNGASATIDMPVENQP